MEMSNSIANLAAALSKFQGEVGAAIKSTKNDFLNRKYATLTDIWDTIRVPLAENDLSVTQLCEESFVTPRVDKFTTAEAVAVSVKESPILMVSVSTVLLHKSGEWISGKVTIPAHKEEKSVLKIDPQAAGSAITYARRYALAAILGIIQEDDDGQGGGRTSKPTVSAPEREYSTEITPEMEAEDISATRKAMLADLDKSPIKAETKAAFRKEIETALKTDKGIADWTGKLMLLNVKHSCSEVMGQLVKGKIDRYDNAERRKKSCMQHLDSPTIAEAKDITRVAQYQEHLQSVLDGKDISPRKKAEDMIAAIPDEAKRKEGEAALANAASQPEKDRDAAYGFIIDAFGGV